MRKGAGRGLGPALGQTVPGSSCKALWWVFVFGVSGRVLTVQVWCMAVLVAKNLAWTILCCFLNSPLNLNSPPTHTCTRAHGLHQTRQADGPNPALSSFTRAQPIHLPPPSLTPTFIRLRLQGARGFDQTQQADCADAALNALTISTTR